MTVKYRIPSIPSTVGPESYQIFQAMRRILLDYEARIADMEANKADTDATFEFTAGFTTKPYLHGEISSGTLKPLPKWGNLQHVINGGAHILLPPEDDCVITLCYVNNGSAGAVTTSGFTHVDGSYATTDTYLHFGKIEVCRGSSLLTWTALQ